MICESPYDIPPPPKHTDKALLYKEGNGDGVTTVKPTGIMGVRGRDPGAPSPNNHLTSIPGNGWGIHTQTHNTHPPF